MSDLEFEARLLPPDRVQIDPDDISKWSIAGCRAFLFMSNPQVNYEELFRDFTASE
jgi:hypothetical protein